MPNGVSASPATRLRVAICGESGRETPAATHRGERRQPDRREHDAFRIGHREDVAEREDREVHGCAVRERLARYVGGTPVLRLEVDPDLIGGLVVQVSNDVYDASIRNRLELHRQRLIEGKTHEIQSRRDHFSHPE